MRRAALLILLVSLTALDARTASADPDPVALLRAAEAAREPLHGKLVIKVRSESIQPKKGESRQYSLDIVFDRERRRFVHEETIFTLDPPKPGKPSPEDQFKAIGRDKQRAVALGIAHWEPTRTRLIYDGAQTLSYSEQGGGQILAQKPGPPYPCFDPRILGLAHSPTVTESLGDALGYRTAKEVRLVGREEIRGQPVWHVLVVVDAIKGTGERHFWVEDREGYRVHRYERRAEPKPQNVWADRVELFYSPNGGPHPYPVRVERHASYPRQEYQVTYDVESADLKSTPDQSLFGYKGLEMPPGAMVIDERISQVAGYWDGEGLGPDRPAAVKQAVQIAAEEEEGGRGRRWLFPAITATAVLALVVGLRYWRRSAPRAQPA
jgi:hypothetical protein